MKKAEEILEAYPELEYDDVIEAMKEYAKLAIEEQISIIAIEARTDSAYHDVDVDSVLYCTRVELK